MRAAILEEFGQPLLEGLIDARPILSRRFSLDEVNEAFRAAEACKVITGIVEPGSAAPS